MADSNARTNGPRPVSDDDTTDRLSPTAQRILEAGHRLREEREAATEKRFVTRVASLVDAVEEYAVEQVARKTYDLDALKSKLGLPSGTESDEIDDTPGDDEASSEDSLPRGSEDELNRQIDEAVQDVLDGADEDQAIRDIHRSTGWELQQVRKRFIAARRQEERERREAIDVDPVGQTGDGVDDDTAGSGSDDDKLDEQETRQFINDELDDLPDQPSEEVYRRILRATMAKSLLSAPEVRTLMREITERRKAAQQPVKSYAEEVREKAEQLGHKATWTQKSRAATDLAAKHGQSENTVRQDLDAAIAENKPGLLARVNDRLKRS